MEVFTINRENKKIVADNLFKINISSLKLNEFLKTSPYGIINITYDKEGLKDGIHLVVSLTESDPYLYFYYSILQPDGKYKDIEYRVDLEVTPGKFGGRRFWYKCPVEILGCDRRVAVLYKVGDYLCCRNCFDLTYKSRNKRSPYGLGVINMKMVCESRDPRNWKYYKGKPTRRLKRLIKMDEKFKKSLAIFNAKMDAKHKKTLEKMEPFMQKERKLIEEAEKHRLDALRRSAGDVPAKDLKSE